jgi:hypothetical protein
MPHPDRVMPTVGEIASRLGQPLHRIEYVIRSRHVRPTGRAGNSRVFTEEDVAQIAAELSAIDRRKGGAS